MTPEEAAELRPGNLIELKDGTRAVVERVRPWRIGRHTFGKTTWVRVSHGGVKEDQGEPYGKVPAGEIVGEVSLTDPEKERAKVLYAMCLGLMAARSSPRIGGFSPCMYPIEEYNAHYKLPEEYLEAETGLWRELASIAPMSLSANYDGCEIYKTEISKRKEDD